MVLKRCVSEKFPLKMAILGIYVRFLERFSQQKRQPFFQFKSESQTFQLARTALFGLLERSEQRILQGAVSTHESKKNNGMLLAFRNVVKLGGWLIWSWGSWPKFLHFNIALMNLRGVTILSHSREDENQPMNQFLAAVYVNGDTQNIDLGFKELRRCQLHPIWLICFQIMISRLALLFSLFFESSSDMILLMEKKNSWSKCWFSPTINIFVGVKNSPVKGYPLVFKVICIQWSFCLRCWCHFFRFDWKKRSLEDMPTRCFCSPYLFYVTEQTYASNMWSPKPPFIPFIHQKTHFFDRKLAAYTWFRCVISACVCFEYHYCVLWHWHPF